MSAPTTIDADARARCRAQTPFRRGNSEADEQREGEVPVPCPRTHDHPNLPLQTWDSLEPTAKKAGSHGVHAYSWAKKYAVVMSRSSYTMMV